MDATVNITIIIAAASLVANLLFGGLGALFAYMKLVGAVKDKVAEGHVAIVAQINNIQQSMTAQLHALELKMTEQMTDFKGQLDHGADEFKDIRDWQRTADLRMARLEEFKTRREASASTGKVTS